MRTLVATLACAIVLVRAGATHDGTSALTPHPAETTLRVEVVEDWGPAPDIVAGRGGDARSRPPAGRPAGGQSRRPEGSLVGRVDVRRAVGAAVRRPAVTELAAPAPRDAAAFRRAVVYLDPAPIPAFASPAPMRARIDQQDETFLPHVVAVTAGSVVDFPNSDRTYHNVFSLSRTRRFDLGRYPQGASRSVRFDRPGVVRVFCDIHSHMSAFVLVFGHRYFAVTDPEGGAVELDFALP